MHHYGGMDIIQLIKIRTLRCARHVCVMNPEIIPQKLVEEKIYTTRRAVRPELARLWYKESK